VLKGEQQALYDAIATAAATPGHPLRARISELGGGKALIEALTTLALPRALQSDDRLRATLYGSERLMDDEPASVIRSNGTPAADVDATAHQLTGALGALEADGTNRLLALRTDWLSRVDEFSAAVNAQLAPIQAGQTLDTPISVSNTLAELRLARRILTMPADAVPRPRADAVPPPRIDGLRIRPSRFSVMSTAKKKARTVKKKARRGGARVQYRLSVDARMTFTVKRVLRGRLRGGRCKLSGRTRKRARRCTVYRPVPGRLQRASHAGANTMRFTGRLARRPLRPGRYQLEGRAVDPEGQASNVARRSFVVIRRRRA
jgi:hypothetical protein